MSEKPVVVVGAGLGGLAVALRLAHLGERVLVLEKSGAVGGRAGEVRVGGSVFDGGPTLLMMLDPFRKLFADAGERLEDHLDLTLCDPSYRVFYADGSKLDATPNLARMMRRIEEMSGRPEALRYPEFLGRLAALYREAIPSFVERNYRSPADLASLGSLRKVVRHGMLGNLAARVERTFQDPRLRMLFSFQTMYLGLSPYESPWVYATLAYMEFGEGIWYPRGGLAEIPRVVARLAEERGAVLRLSSPVAKIEGKRVLLASGEEIEAKAVVCNADLPYAERALVGGGGKGARRRRSSCSAFMLYIDYRGELSPLLHHNVFFGSDFRGNLEAIFRDHAVPSDPAFYACVSSRTETANASPGHENLFLLVPCPNLDHSWSDADACALQDAVFRRLEREAGFDESRIVGIRTRTPRDWSKEFNLDRGAAFGLSHHFLQSACFRPTNFSRDENGLFFVGASTTPGNGLPMVLISADLAVQRMRERGAL
ncbi:MAG TPA: phytoene desaturase family protein [Fimbriimonas sp.]